MIIAHYIEPFISEQFQTSGKQIGPLCAGRVPDCRWMYIAGLFIKPLNQSGIRWRCRQYGTTAAQTRSFQSISLSEMHSRRRRHAVPAKEQWKELRVNMFNVKDSNNSNPLTNYFSF